MKPVIRNQNLSRQQHSVNQVNRLEVGSPVQQKEQLIWKGYPSFAYAIPRLAKSLFFIILWFYLYSQRFNFLNRIDAPDADLIGMIAGYVLLFFIFLNVIAIIKTVLAHINTVYTFTSQRVIMQTGILNIKSYQIELFRLKDFAKQQSLWARITGYCNVVIISSDRIRPNMVLWGLPYGDQLTEAVRAAAQVARSQAGQVSISE